MNLYKQRIKRIGNLLHAKMEFMLVCIIKIKIQTEKNYERYTSTPTVFEKWYIWSF